MSITCDRCRSASAEVDLPYAGLRLCPRCFKDYYIRRVRRTVEDFKMFKPNDRVGVAVSGGKDSMALLHSLKQAFPSAEFIALHVDLGIKGYSEHCRERVEELVGMLNVKLKVFDIQEELGFSIEDFRKTPYRRKVCSACGTIKRHLFEVLAERAETKILATGHNLDDFVSMMFNNFFNANWPQLVRLKPVLEPSMPNQTIKVKPLIRAPEEENLLYCLYSDVPFRGENCPYAHTERLRRNRETLGCLSKGNPNFKYQMLRTFLKLIPILEERVEKPKLIKCKVCGYPSSSQICAFCRRVEMVKEALRGIHSTSPHVI